MPLRWKDLWHLVWVRKSSLFLQRCFRCFVTDTRTVVWECASSSLEMNSWGFQQVLLLPHQESKSDSPLFLLLWPHSTQDSSPFVLKHLCQILSLTWSQVVCTELQDCELIPGALREVQVFCFQHQETASLYPSERIKSFLLSFLSLFFSLGFPWTEEI